MTDYIKGIDVSSVQGVIDWPSVKASGVEFAICKNYQGNGGQDPNYMHNITGASAAGLQVATYNFVYPLPDTGGHPNRNPVDQAKLHFAATKTGIVAADLEWPATQDWTKWGCSASQINDWCLQYLETYKTLMGAFPLVYTYPYWAKAVNFSAEIAQYPLWVASYEPAPAPIAPWGDNWVIWQNTGGTEHLPNGVPVDTDLVKDLSLWGL